jgi:thioredoxin
MKKVIILSVLAAFFIAGCSNAEGGEGKTAAKNTKAEATVLVKNDKAAVEKSEKTEKTTAGKNGAKPIHLDKASFKKLIMDYEKNPREWVYEGDKPAVIDFYADWCRPCRMIAPIMEELAVEYEGQVDIYKIDTEAQKELAAVFGITSLPTVLFVPTTGKPSAQKGALPKESYKQIINEFLLNQSTQTQ